MFFLDEYKSHPKARISSELLWEYDLDQFDWCEMRDVVVERVVELGTKEDWWAVYNLYGGKQGVREIIKNEVRFLSPYAINFVCVFFDLKKEELHCWKRKQEREKFLNSAH